MEGRRDITKEKLDRLALLQHLFNFDRFTVHQIDADTKEKIMEAISLLEDISPLTPDLPLLYKQIGIYFLFNERNEKKSVEYIAQALSLLGPDALGTSEYAVLTSLIAHAHTINGGYYDTTLFEEALRILNQRSMETILDEVIFSRKYLALMHYRSARFVQQPNDHLETAIKMIEEVIEMTKTSPNPLSIIDRAECFQLLAVMRKMQGQRDLAKEHLLEAITLEEEFCRITNAPHFLLFISKQSYGEILWLLKDYDQAIQVLEETIGRQSAFYGTGEHPDIAKSWHFLGNACKDKGELDKAVQCYLNALKIKKLFFSRDEDMVKVTRQALLEMLQQHTHTMEPLLGMLTVMNQVFFDWNDPDTIPFSKENITQCEALVDVLQEMKEGLSAEAVRELDQLCYKMGAFYAHLKTTSSQTQTAITLGWEKLEPLCTSSLTDREKAWVKNQQVYLLHQKMLDAIAAREEMSKEYHDKCRSLEVIFSDDDSLDIEYQRKVEAYDQEIKKYKAQASCAIEEVLAEYGKSEEAEAVKLVAFAECMQRFNRDDQAMPSGTSLKELINAYRNLMLVFESKTPFADEIEQRISELKMEKRKEKQQQQAALEREKIFAEHLGTNLPIWIKRLPSNETTRRLEDSAPDTESHFSEQDRKGNSRP